MKLLLKCLNISIVLQSVKIHLTGNDIELSRFSDDSTFRSCNKYGFDRCSCTIDGYDSNLRYSLTIIGRNDFGEVRSSTFIPREEIRSKTSLSDEKIRPAASYSGENKIFDTRSTNLCLAFHEIYLSNNFYNLFQYLWLHSIIITPNVTPVRWSADRYSATYNLEKKPYNLEGKSMWWRLDVSL